MNNDMIEKIKCFYKFKVEVAFFISNLSDVSGAEEGKGKEKVPKGRRNLKHWFLGVSVKNGMTVIERWSAIQRKHVMIS